MDQVTTVATWAGLLVGIVSITLAVVAIVTARWVDIRAREINDQVIQSLGKIETQVGGTSEEIKNLIKVAWERMLPSNSSDPVATLASDEEAIRAITAGVAAELRANLTPPIEAILDKEPLEQSQVEQVITERVNASASTFEQTLLSQLRVQPPSVASNTFDRVYKTMEQAPPQYRELARALAHRGALTRPQYLALQKSPLFDFLLQLRHEGYLVPLVEDAIGGNDIVIYGLLPIAERHILAVMTVIEPDGAAAAFVNHFLVGVGYPPPPENFGTSGQRTHYLPPSPKGSAGWTIVNPKKRKN
jgi:hypothetical protein